MARSRGGRLAASELAPPCVEEQQPIQRPRPSYSRVTQLTPLVAKGSPGRAFGVKFGPCTVLTRAWSRDRRRSVHLRPKVDGRSYRSRFQTLTRKGLSCQMHVHCMLVTFKRIRSCISAHNERPNSLRIHACIGLDGVLEV